MDVTVGLAGHRLMVLSRAIDDVCAGFIKSGVDVPNYHGARGQEATYAGCGVALEEADFLLYNYRAFATLLAKGVTITELCADLLLRTTGTSKGHGGIMHVVKPDRGIVGRNGVFGSKFGMAAGLGLAIRMRQEHAAVLCMFGEAEGNRGTIYEALNLAILEQLPLVFAAENNGYAVAARTADLYAGGNMADVFRGFPLPVSSVDGNDVLAVHAAIGAALDRARNGDGPSFVELRSYRVDPHHAHDDDSLYRDDAELRTWQERDPIRRVEKTLQENGVSRAGLRTVHEEVGAEVRQAMDAALAAPLPRVDGMHKYVYYDQVVSGDGRGELP